MWDLLMHSGLYLGPLDAARAASGDLGPLDALRAASGDLGLLDVCRAGYGDLEPLDAPRAGYGEQEPLDAPGDQLPPPLGAVGAPRAGLFPGFKRLVWTRGAAIRALVASHTFFPGDLQTDEEFNQLLNGFVPARQEEPALLFQASAAVKTPAEVDWRAKGYVTPVKNQVGMG